MASEHSDGESLSVISTGSPLFQVNVTRVWDVSPTTRSAKLQLIYGLKMSKTATLDTHCLLVHVLHVWMVATLKGGGGVTPPASP